MITYICAHNDQKIQNLIKGLRVIVIKCWKFYMRPFGACISVKISALTTNFVAKEYFDLVPRFGRTAVTDIIYS